MTTLTDRTLDTDSVLHRAKVYGWLASVFVYPRQNWSEDAEFVAQAAQGLGYPEQLLTVEQQPLAELQTEYMRTLGLSGPLAYETEYGLENAYRQSQELADISGFYRAFGFNVGGPVQERPDHLAAELEFMYLLGLKQLRAVERGRREQAEVCQDAQRKFLEDHLGRWIEGFALRLAFEAKDSLYAYLGKFVAEFVKHDARRLGAEPDPLVPDRLRPTPFDASDQCGECMAADGFVQEIAT